MSCHLGGQEHVQLHIINRSGKHIDSIVLPANSISHRQRVETGDSVKLTVTVWSKDISGEGLFPLYLYRGGVKTYVSWGLHDFGRLAKTDERFYVFDNGVNWVNEPLKPPAQFTLYVVDKSKTRTDSIQLMPGVARKSALQPTFYKFEADFDSLKTHPYLRAKRSGKWKTMQIVHDWNNWNVTERMLYLHDDEIRYSE
jgi:hypothetical protein